MSQSNRQIGVNYALIVHSKVIRIRAKSKNEWNDLKSFSFITVDYIRVASYTFHYWFSTVSINCRSKFVPTWVFRLTELPYIDPITVITQFYIL